MKVEKEKGGPVEYEIYEAMIEKKRGPLLPIDARVLVQDLPRATRIPGRMPFKSSHSCWDIKRGSIKKDGVGGKHEWTHLEEITEAKAKHEQAGEQTAI